MYKFGILLALLAGLSGMAEEIPTPQIEETTSVPVQNVFGLLELRPSYPAAGGVGYTENTARLGWRVSETVALDYTQYFSTPLTGTFALSGEGSFARLTKESLWESPAEDAYLGWEVRAEFPTGAALQETGLVTAIRNDLKLDLLLAPQMWLTFTGGVVFGIYQTNGYWATDDDAVANPWFQSRAEAEFYWNINDKLAFGLPLTFTQTKRRFFDDVAPRNDQWVASLTLLPEVTYALSPNIYLGLSYGTDNLMQEDFGGFQFAEGFENGVAQAIFGAKL